MKLPVALLIISLFCLAAILITTANSYGNHIWAGVFAFLGFLKMFDRGEH